MPELPEVETVRRALKAVLEGHVLARVVARRHDLRVPVPADFAVRIEGRRVRRVGRRAKYLVIHLDDGTVLMVHLGMSGSFKVFAGAPPPPARHDHVLFETDAGVAIRFSDPRRFGLMVLTDKENLATHPLLAGIGPEPLDGTFDGPLLASRLDGRIGPLKTVLLDQTVVAGLGNIYVCESLFRAGLSPRRRAGTVKGHRAVRLAEALAEVLAEAIAAGGSSLRDHRQPSGEVGYFQHSFAVYGRQGEPCPGCDCDVAHGGGIRRIVQSGRSTFFCAKRQR